MIPKWSFLDEPMSGLDPIGRREVRDIILDLKNQGRTVFFSTHILSDAEMLCDRVAVLVDGKLQGVGAPGEIVSMDVVAMDILFELKEGRALPQRSQPSRQKLGRTIAPRFPKRDLYATLEKLRELRCAHPFRATCSTIA